VRYFLSGRHPSASAILLVESGGREILEHLATNLRSSWGVDIPIDLVTCYATAPRGFEENGARVYRVADYQGKYNRRELYRELARNGYSHVGIICSGEPLMLKWKWALALRLPAKVFITNENGDYFWLDRRHARVIWRFAADRAGLTGVGAVRTLLRIISFPFTTGYLILYAAVVHARRALRGDYS
jgi:hypothetical protein